MKRLEKKTSSVLPADIPAIRRVPLCVSGLDERIQGGVPEGSVILVSGISGTMKSSLCFNVLFNEAAKGKNGLYITLEQNYDSLLMHLKSMELDFRKVNLLSVTDFADLNSKLSSLKPNGGNIILADISSLRKSRKASDEDPNSSLFSAIKQFVTKLKGRNCDLFVLDSLSALYLVSKFENPRKDLFYFFEFLRDSKVTSFLISEMPLKRDRYGDYEIEEFMADGVIKLDLVERQRKVTREISVVKMRSTRCSNDVFSLEFDKGKFSALYGGQPPLL